MEWSYRSGVHFSVLGPLRVTDADGCQVDVRGAKERTLLAHLVADAGRMVPVTALVDSLWGDAPPRTATKSLQTYVLRLRNTLEPTRSGTPSVLLTDGAGYRLAIGERDVDAGQFSALVALGRRSLQEGRADAAQESLAQALDLWRGPAYAGFEHTAFGLAEGRRLEELRLSAVEERCAARLAQGQGTAVAPELERLVAEHPLRERLWALLVLALYRGGRQGDALGAYERARMVLDDELGVEPGHELKELHARVLAQDPTLLVRPPRVRLPAALESAGGSLVGREAELAALRSAWEQARAGGAVSVVVRGPSGAGGSRLVAALAEEVARAGAAVLMADEAVPGRGPTLVVADHVPPPHPGPSMLVVALSGDGTVPSQHATVLDLRPLDVPAVREVVAGYLTGTDLDRVTEQVLAESGGWPGRVHESAARHARSAAVRRVEHAAAVTGRSSAALSAARAALTDGVVALQATSALPGPRSPEECPWKGMQSYDVDDAPWFTGRERLVAELVSRLADRRLIGVVGASGSGKSSVVRAGLLAALADGALPGSSAWLQIVLRPGAHPMRELTRHALGGRRAVGVGALLEHLVRDDPAASGERVVLVVDQLEEVWTTCHDEGERLAFLDLLVELATDPRSPVTVVLSLRADFLARAADHPGLAVALRDGTVLVGAPTPAEIRRVVERPASRAGLRLDDGLAETIVSDAGSEPGLLPLLSTALTRLWQRREGSELTYTGYVALGGFSGAIAELAEDVHGRLDESGRTAARLVLLRLTGPGEGTAVTRRQAPVAELVGLAHPGVPAAVEALTAGRLLTRTGDRVEVAHEALYREWPRLRSWLLEDGAGRAVQRRLALAAAEWQAEHREPGLLWRGARLASGLDAAELRPEEITATERAFLDAGVDAAEQERRSAEERAATTARQNSRLRGLLGGLAVVLVLAVLAGLLALRSRDEAEASQVTAEAKRLAAAALNEEKRDVALLSAVEAVRREADPATYGALLSLLAQAPEAVTSFRTPQRFLRLAVSADGSTLVLGENGPVLRGVDAVTGRQRWRVDVPEDAQVGRLTSAPQGRGVFAPVFARDTAGILLDERDGSEVWRVGTRDLRRAAGRGFVPWLFSGSGWLRRGPVVLATGSHVFELDPADGEVLRAVPWPEPVPAGETLVVWPDGRLSTGGEDGAAALVFDPDRPEDGFSEVAGRVVAVSPDADRVAVAKETPAGEVLRLHDARTLRARSAPHATGGFTRNAAWSADGSVLAVGVDSTVRLFDGRTADEAQSVTAHSGAVMEVAFVGRRHDRLWSAARDGTAVGLDLTGELSVVRGEEMEARPHVGTGAAGSGLVAALRWVDNAALPAVLVDSATGVSLFGDLPMDGLQKDCVCQVAAVGITPDGSTALGGVEVFEQRPGEFLPVTDRGHLVVWDTDDGSVSDVVDLPWPVYGIDVTADSATAVVQGRTGYALLDLEDLSTTFMSDDLAAMSWVDGTQTVETSPDGRLAALARDATLLLVDLDSGEVVEERSLADEIGLLTLAWSADGEVLVTGSVRGGMRFLDSTLEGVAPRRDVAAGFVIDLETSPDGRVVASMGSDGDVRLWDTRTWAPYGQPLLDDRGWGVLDFADDGSELRVLYEDGMRFEIDTEPVAWIDAACAAANRDLTAEEWAVVLPGEPRRTTCS